MSAVGVIPARFGSSRLPGKPLVDLRGKPLLFYVYQRAKRARLLDAVLIATDDERVCAVAEGFGAKTQMTRSDHRSGTDRIAEAVKNIAAEIVVNIQGDEPLIEPAAIDRVVQMLQENPEAQMATLRSPIENDHELRDPNVVKVVTDENDNALYFSRAPIPHSRKKSGSLEASFRHIGLYAYRKDFLLRFAQWAPTELEKCEDLEQLRALEHGATIKVDTLRTTIVGIDTPEDLERIRSLVDKNPSLLDV